MLPLVHTCDVSDDIVREFRHGFLINQSARRVLSVQYLTVILRGRAGCELINITNEAVGRVGYYQLISGKSEKNNCFNKFSSYSLDFFGWNLRKSWHFLYRRRGEKIFSDLQNFGTRNSPSVFPYLVKLKVYMTRTFLLAYSKELSKWWRMAFILLW